MQLKELQKERLKKFQAKYIQFKIYVSYIYIQIIILLHCCYFCFPRYAEMPSETKNSISHRSKALKALKEYFDSTVVTNDDKQNGEPENKKPRNSSDST